MVLKVAVTEGKQKALILDEACLEQLDAAGASEFEVTRNGNVIELRPVPFDRRAHVRALADSTMATHDETFRKLSQ